MTKEKLFRIIFGKKGMYGWRYWVYFHLFGKDEKTIWDVSLRNGNGLYSDKKFIVLGRKSSSDSGICSYMIVFLALLSYWEKKDPTRIPVIDMMNFESPYLDKEKLGIENAWEYFFEQISDYSLEDIYKSKDVVIAGMFYKGIREKMDSISGCYSGGDCLKT